MPKVILGNHASVLVPRNAPIWLVLKADNVEEASKRILGAASRRSSRYPTSVSTRPCRSTRAAERGRRREVKAAINPMSKGQA